MVDEDLAEDSHLKANVSHDTDSNAFSLGGLRLHGHKFWSAVAEVCSVHQLIYTLQRI